MKSPEKAICKPWKLREENFENGKKIRQIITGDICNLFYLLSIFDEKHVNHWTLLYAYCYLQNQVADRQEIIYNGAYDLLKLAIVIPVGFENLPQCYTIILDDLLGFEYL